MILTCLDTQRSWRRYGYLFVSYFLRNQVICEEFEFMDPAVFIQVAAPVLVSAHGAAFMAITTKGESDNFVQSLIQKKRPNGDSLMNFIEMDLICNECKRAETWNRDTMACQHFAGELPEWQSSERHEDIQILLSDFQDDYNREVRGVQSDSNIAPCFPIGRINNLLQEKFIYTKDIQHTFIFHSIDPALGGAKSKTAITSLIYEDGDVVVCDFFFMMYLLYIFSKFLENTSIFGFTSK